MEIDIKHNEWIKKTAKLLDIDEKEVIHAVIEHAKTTGIMEAYKSKVVANQLVRTLDQLSEKAQAIAGLKEKAEAQLKKLQANRGDGR